MSPSQPGDLVRIAGSDRTLRLGPVVGMGASARVFEVAEDAAVVAKMYLGPFPERLNALRPHLRRVFLGPGGEGIREGAVCAFPIAYLTRDGEPAGFLMRRFAIGGAEAAYVTLEELVNSAASADPDVCLLIARRLARDVEFFHEHGLIVGDMSLRNILIKTSDGQIAWVDLDSFGAEADGDVPAVATYARTVRFFPPELNRPGVPSSRESDRFALGMHVLTLLTLQALHPYAIDRTGGEPLTDETRIERGLSWMVEPEAYATANVRHGGLAAWPSALSAVGRALLVNGVADPSARPTARLWRETLAGLTPADLTAAARPAVAPGRAAGGAPHAPSGPERTPPSGTSHTPDGTSHTPDGTSDAPGPFPPGPFPPGPGPAPGDAAPDGGSAGRRGAGVAAALAVVVAVLVALGIVSTREARNDTPKTSGAGVSRTSATRTARTYPPVTPRTTAPATTASPRRTEPLVYKGDCLSRDMEDADADTGDDPTVPCTSGQAVFTVTRAQSPYSSDSCPQGEGSWSWRFDGLRYCLDRVFRTGQCSPANDRGEGNVSAGFYALVDCGTRRLPEDFNAYLKITQVLDGSSRTCADRGAYRYTLERRGLTICAELWTTRS